MLTVFVLSILFLTIYATSPGNSVSPEPHSPVQNVNSIVHQKDSNTIVEYDFMNVFPAKSSTARVESPPDTGLTPSKRRRVFKTEQEKKEAKKLRDKAGKIKRRMRLKNLPAGHEEKEATLEYDRKRNKALRERMAQLPDDDERKIRFKTSISNTQKSWKARKRMENPDFFADQQRRRRAKKKMAKLMARS